jgi:hypothetical protein
MNAAYYAEQSTRLAQLDAELASAPRTEKQDLVRYHVRAAGKLLREIAEASAEAERGAKAEVKNATPA